LERFDATRGLTLEAAIVSLVLQNVEDNPGEFLCDDRSDNALVGSSDFSLIEGPDFRVILDGMDSDVAEGDLEIAVAILVV
jgi:hypothetical protein